MSERQKTLQLKQFNTDYPITLTFDKCKSGESQYGPWNLYGVEHDGEEQSLFAEDALHQELKKYGKGSKLVIRRNQDGDGKLAWQVTPANGNSQSKPKQTVISYLDDRTKDIHRQVALKIATISIGQSTKPWTDEDLQEIKVRMDKLLVILDGQTEDDLPF
ncbi:hypothetical protein ACFL4H_02170 [Candidatus Neomarinimicrobiota bacterium]